MPADFLFALVPFALGAALVVGLIVFAIRRAIRSNQPQDRAAFQAQARADLEARRGELAPLDGPASITGRGRLRYTSFAYTVVNGEVHNSAGQPVARYRLRSGAGSLDAVIVTRAETWTLASGEGGQVFTRGGQPFGRWVGTALKDATGQPIGSFAGSRGSVQVASSLGRWSFGRRGWQPVTLHGRVVGEVNDGGAAPGGLVRAVSATLDEQARAWLTLLALRAAVELGETRADRPISTNF